MKKNDNEIEKINRKEEGLKQTDKTDNGIEDVRYSNHKINTFKVGMFNIEGLDEAVGHETRRASLSSTGEQLIIGPIRPESIEKVLQAKLIDDEDKTINKFNELDLKYGQAEALELKGESADERIKLTGKEALELNEIIDIFRVNGDKMLKVVPESIDNKSIPKDGMHFLILENDLKAIKSKLQSLGFDADDIEIEGKKIGATIEKSGIKFVFIFASEKGNHNPDIFGENKGFEDRTEINEPEQYKTGKEIGRGGNSVAYEVLGHPELIIIKIGEAWGGKAEQEVLQRGLKDSKDMIEKFKDLPAGVNAPKILKAWIKDDSLYQLMEKAFGRSIHDRKGSFEDWNSDLRILSEAPLEQYKKLAADAEVIEETGFKIDPSKPDNFYYDKEMGFSFIDLDVGNYKCLKDIEIPLIYTFNLFTKHKNKITGEIKKHIVTIIDKLKMAGIKLEEKRLAEIYEFINNKESKE